MSRGYCPMDEIPWAAIYYRDRPMIGNDEPDPEGELMGIELMVSRYRAGYPPRDGRQDWIEKRLRAWHARAERR